ncbi:adenylate/guanylate cyclase domain-containing protein, partial [Muriicola sp.]|uniref:adenylate/guanylate cyclase domain-containing protein n=1 Tax=Muriicola sp. TaxID=2020856 RepID=UPI003C77B8A5
MSQSRQLAAIMFTDIVGYTALMGKDEQNAFRLLQQNRDLQKPIIKKFNGRWIKELGDGVMASFKTVSDAVNAAVKIQEACNTANDFQLRIGIHLGEVVFENDDVFGDTVNIASRIQGVAQPGCIFISETVQHNVTNKNEFKSQFVKEMLFKNVPQPMRMYQVLFAGSEIIEAEKLSEPVIEKSIAVLPFVNMSSDPEQEYFSDGITEEIINVLAQVPVLKVIGRTSSFAFKGKNMDLKEIGEKLRVTHILEGSVRRAGNKLRITAQLIKVSDGFHLYSEKFDRELEDIFAIQDEISLAILDAIKIKLLGAEKKAVVKKYTDNVEAYKFYMKGRYHFNKLSPNDFLKAIEYFQAAIDIDATYAIAYADMGTCYWDMAYSLWAPGEQIIPKALTAINKGLELDPESDVCHVAKGRFLLWSDWDFEQAAMELEKVIQINPNNVEGLRQLGVLNILQGNYAIALIYYKKAEDLDPLSLLGLTYTGQQQWFGGFFDKMLVYGNRLITLEPNFFGGHQVLGMGYAGLE